MFPINGSIASTALLMIVSITIWTVSVDENYWSEATNWIFVVNTTSSPNQYINSYQPAVARLQLDELFKPQPRCFCYFNESIPQAKQNDCPSFPYLPEVKHKVLAKFYALKAAQNNKATSICKILPVEGNYVKLGGYAIKNCTKLQDKPPTQQ